VFALSILMQTRTQPHWHAETVPLNEEIGPGSFLVKEAQPVPRGKVSPVRGVSSEVADRLLRKSIHEGEASCYFLNFHAEAGPLWVDEQETNGPDLATFDVYAVVRFYDGVGELRSERFDAVAVLFEKRDCENG
jgi:hypothetical protein